jgi:rhodanese-related sulfurtransferase
MASQTQDIRRVGRNAFRERLQHTIDNAMLASQLQQGAVQGVVLDLRKPEEYAKGHIPGARNVHLRDVVAFAQQQPPGTRFITSCYHTDCLLATRAAADLVDAGFRAKELKGGWERWAQAQPGLVERGPA